MGATLTSLRDFIQADAGTLTLQRVVVPVARSVRETVEAMKPHLPDGTGLRIDVETTVPQRVLFDRERLRLAVASLVALGLEDAKAGLTQAEAWRMAPTPHANDAGEQVSEGAQGAASDAPVASAASEQARWIGSHLQVSFDASAGQLVFVLRTPARDMTDEMLQAKLSPLNDVTRMKEASWRRWLDLAIVDRLATQSGGQAITRQACDDACVLMMRIAVGVAENTPTLPEAIVMEFGEAMPSELRASPVVQAADATQDAGAVAAAREEDGHAKSSAGVDVSAGSPAQHPHDHASGDHADHPAANIPISEANVAAAVDCSDAADLGDKPGRRAA
jgi:limonene-1,2-epoxide hydrolase